MLASPLRVLQRSGSLDRDHRGIAEICREEEITLIVVGLPISLSGAISHAARAARDEIDQLATVVGVPVEVQDERLTTVTAQRRLREVPGRQRRPGDIDMYAAAVILQTWLDAHRTPI